MDANDKASIEQRLRALEDTLASISSSAARLCGRMLEGRARGLALRRGRRINAAGGCEVLQQDAEKRTSAACSLSLISPRGREDLGRKPVFMQGA